MITEAIVLAGGLGTRLRSEVQDQPKCMAVVNGRPFLEYVLDYLIHEGIRRVILSVGYKAEAITGYFGDCYRTCTLVYAHEAQPLGTGGAIQNAMNSAITPDVAVLNGDSVFLIDVQGQYQYHIECGAELTLALHRMQNIDRYGTVELDAAGRIIRFREKQALPEGFINAGLYVFKVARFRENSFSEKFSIEKDYFEALVHQCYFAGFPAEGYFLDIGIPEDYHRAQKELPTVTDRYLKTQSTDGH